MKGYHLYLGNEEHTLAIESLVNLKNKLLKEGRYTDAVDELIVKTINAPVKKIRIK